MANIELVNLEKPRFVDGPAMRLAGLTERFADKDCGDIPLLWQRFVPHIGHVAGQIGGVTYGACYDGDGKGNFTYMCAMEVNETAELPKDFVALDLKPAHYAVFKHQGHITLIGRTWDTVWTKWLPESEYEFGKAPNLERVGEGFNSETGLGDVEIWLPVKRKAL